MGHGSVLAVTVYKSMVSHSTCKAAQAGQWSAGQPSLPGRVPFAALAKASGTAEASHLLCELEPPKDSEGRPLAGMAHAVSLEGDSGGWVGGWCVRWSEWMHYRLGRSGRGCR